MTGDSMTPWALVLCALPTPLAAQAGGIGNIGFAEANAVGQDHLDVVALHLRINRAAPWFWPSTNLVGP